MYMLTLAEQKRTITKKKMLMVEVGMAVRHKQEQQARDKVYLTSLLLFTEIPLLEKQQGVTCTLLSLAYYRCLCTFAYCHPYFNHQILLPHAHAQGVKQSIVVVTKIARSGILSIYACCNYYELSIMQMQGARGMWSSIVVVLRLILSFHVDHSLSLAKLMLNT